MPEYINHPAPFSLNPQRYDNDRRQWKTPIVLALSTHVLVFILLIMPPSFLTRHRDFQEIQTINLFTPDEIKPVERHHKTQAKTRHKPAVKKIKPAKPIAPKNTKSINIDDQPKPLAKPEKVLSLRPRKIKKRPPKPLKKVNTSDDLLRKALERTKARINEKKEIRQVKHALADLVKNLHTISEPPEKPAQVETQPQAQEPATVTTNNNGRGKSTGPSSAAIDKAMRQYYMAISRRIHDNWSLPETQNWSPSLEAIFVIVVQRNGTLLKTFFEKKSPNIYFNQYVEKTITASAPMPAFPADIKKDRLEIGLKFRPSGMF